MDIDIQDYCQVTVFLNGVYWGIYNIREKLDKYYLQNNHQCNSGNIDLIKNYSEVKAGSSARYNTMIQFIKTHDLAVPKHYQAVTEHIDINEYINYQIAEIFYDNCDWPQNNVACWREKISEGRWRWILYDTDDGFQFKGRGKSCDRNTLHWATRANTPCTFLFTSLLKNTEFKNRFLQTFAAHMCSTFKSERIVAFVDKLQNQIRPEMPRHIERWQAISSMQEWEKNVDELRRFARQRHNYVYEHLIRKFHLEGTVSLTLNVNDSDKGHIRMNTVDIPDQTSKGKYFKNIPVTLHAIALPGHKFIRWEGLVDGISGAITFTPQHSGTIRAVFQ
jgi:hypothetical protein